MVVRLVLEDFAEFEAASDSFNYWDGTAKVVLSVIWAVIGQNIYDQLSLVAVIICKI